MITFGKRFLLVIAALLMFATPAIIVFLPWQWAAAEFDDQGPFKWLVRKWNQHGCWWGHRVEDGWECSRCGAKVQ